ncbi:hypothetical protein GOP47_0004449 [Adiantum capillus-veneris]|uniref:Non-specific lipid-transfer protein n=1 Tax=Adiantum capillus-veneris TaxID=13818 RepID=A0A9D4ZPQ0_ADICA|nr:hypothetical protein GOP47_0003717 [Adiantum capillus-veneris]KAI5081266.1 hypothetical protein GOP47_0004449 [Adiantum capillus-veneris]
MEGSRSSSSRVVAALVVVMVVAGSLAERGEAAISCGTVRGKLLPCAGYLTGTSSAPSRSSTCCSGVSSLYSLTKGARADRVTACGCIKQLSTSLGSALKSSSVSALPGLCGVNLGYGISTSTNCATVP